MSDCPSADDIAVFLEGGASGDVSQRVLDHLDSCVPCRLMIANSLQTAGPGSASSVVSGRVQTFRDGEFVNERYRVVRFIARGGMGEVYEARDTQLHETVALKTIVCTGLDNARLFAQLRAEVQIARRIVHPNVCRLLEFGIYCRESRGEKERIPFFTMDLLMGETLGQFSVRRGLLAASQLLPIALQIVEGLIAVHAAGIVHRDLKPDNVFIITGESGEERVVVMDFGLARPLTRPNSLASSTGMNAVGTPAYMAPEQVAGGAPSVAWDIYAIGVVLFEMLAQKLPFEGKTALAVAVAKVNASAPSLSSFNPNIDRRLERIVSRCLERDPRRRYASMPELREALRCVLDVGVANRRRLSASSVRVLVAATACAGALAVWGPLWVESPMANPRRQSVNSAIAAEPRGIVGVSATNAVARGAESSSVPASLAAAATMSASTRASGLVSPSNLSATSDRAFGKRPSPSASTRLDLRPRQYRVRASDSQERPAVVNGTQVPNPPTTDDALAIPQFVTRKSVPSAGNDP